MKNDIDIDKCLNWMRDNAEDLATAKANMIFHTEKRKSIKSDLMQRSLERTESAKESWAYAHIEYKTQIENLRVAVYDYELIRVQMVACELKIEVWRSLEASNRMIDKSHV
jgi:hypothetical protein